MKENLLLKENELNEFYFSIKQESLLNITKIYSSKSDSHNENDYLRGLGGTEYILKELKVNNTKGIDKSTITQRRAYFGSNEVKKIPPKSFFELVVNILEDFTLRVLLCAALFSIIVNYLSEGGHLFWVEGFAIFMAVFLSTIVQAVNDLQKEKQFQQLNEELNKKKIIFGIRNGVEEELNKDDIVVGDIIKLNTGAEIPADGILVTADEFEANESALTGESKNIKKKELENISLANNKSFSCVVLEGTTVATGMGVMIVTAVGKDTAMGKIKEMVTDVDELTPLQIKLEGITNTIGYFGLYSAILIFVILNIRLFYEQFFIVDYELRLGVIMYIKEVLNYFIISIAILVVAIPEGLPLAVTISLAFSVKQMMNDNNLVRKLQACETMGGANVICTDKTGTLTKNEMYWTDMYNTKSIKLYNEIDEKYPNFETITQHSESLELFINANCLNSVSNPNKENQNPTEMAFLKYFVNKQVDVISMRDKYNRVFLAPFSSDRKRMTSVYKINNKYFIFMKGASEYIVESCDNVLNLEENKIEAINKNDYFTAIKNFSKKSLRTVAISYKISETMPDVNSKDNNGVFEFEKFNNILLCIAGIKDVIRPEVPRSIELCKKAGIAVKMVTGDNKLTAEAISKDLGLMSSPEDIVMQGPEFYSLIGGIICKICGDFENCKCKPQANLTLKHPEEFKKIEKNLKVLARSRPMDKLALVIGLKNLENVVAVTGDGTNDAPAMKKADVGFAMGISGTDLAKNSADIILIDDNFASILNAVKWGRNVYDSVRKFLQFQMTVNVVAVAVVFISACIVKCSVLNTVQMLWVNMIMDTLASLALATESPNDDLLERKPYKKSESIINKKMTKHILIQGLYQIIIILLLLFLGKNILNVEYGGEMGGNGGSPSLHFTYIFNIFVVLQLFNFICMRKLNDEVNIFSRLKESKLFVIIWFIILFLQIFFIRFGGHYLKIIQGGLSLKQWLLCTIFGIIGMLINFLSKKINENNIPLFNKLFKTIDNDKSKSALQRWSSLSLKRKTLARQLSRVGSKVYNY